MIYARIVLTIRKQHLKSAVRKLYIAILYCMWPICVGQYICLFLYMSAHRVQYTRVYVYTHTYNYSISILY